jgi:chromosome segregation ATPase
MANKRGAEAYAQEINAIKAQLREKDEANTVRLREKDEANTVRLREKDEAHRREVEAIKGQLEEKDEAHRREVEAIKGQLEEKDERIKEKSRRLQHLENESLDVLTNLRDVVKGDGTNHQKRGEYCCHAHQLHSLITSPYQVA